MQEIPLNPSYSDHNSEIYPLKSTSRLVGLDFGKGFGILAMILIHSIIQQIAEFNGALFVPTFSSIPLIILIILVPLLLLALWGTAFTTFSVIGITNQLLKIPAQQTKENLMYLGTRIISGMIILLVRRIARLLINFFQDWSNFTLHWQNLYNIEADTIDAIVWAGIISAVVFYIVKKFIKNIKQYYHHLSIFFIILAYIWLFHAPLLIQITNPVIDSWADQNFVLGEYILGKFARGRFKLFQTLAFGFMGISFGLLLHYKTRKRILLRYTWIIMGISIIISGIMILIDPSVLTHFVDKDVPSTLQILNLGGLFGLITIFFTQFDYVSVDVQHNRTKKSRWVIRYGLISLTAFTFDTIITRIPFRLMCLIFGPSVDHTVEIPYLRWMWWQIILYVAVVWIFWEIILRLWEKIGFVGSLDWWLMFLMRVILKKGNGKIPIQKILYGNTYAQKTKEKKPDKEN
ncbi:MAG: hypothetical protein ACTSX0_11765 [Promethearchaeota archaeon]